MCELPHPAPVVGMGHFWWVGFVLALSPPGGWKNAAANAGGQPVVPVPVPCGHAGELSEKSGNWPVPTEERGWGAKYGVTEEFWHSCTRAVPFTLGHLKWGLF